MSSGVGGVVSLCDLVKVLKLPHLLEIKVLWAPEEEE